MHYPFDTVGLTSEQVDIFQETYEALRAKFEIEPTGHIDFHLDSFEIFTGNTEVNLKGSFVIKNAKTNCYILFIETFDIKSYNPKNSPTSGHNYYTCALAYLKKDFGRVLIRPETLADKIIELVHPVELDFEDDKAFSDTWYVLTNDRWKADAAMDRNFRNVVMDVRHDGVVIEIIDHTLIIGHNYIASPDAALQLADLVVRICSLC
ncbi:MAG TPA: hypothetical protein VHE59_18640 [Mucilaginibacter sp.]|nr:hypothetical protein [Mucilaginibacter sp.]